MEMNISKFSHTVLRAVYSGGLIIGANGGHIFGEGGVIIFGDDTL